MLVKPLVRPIVRAIAGRATDSLGSGFSPSTLFSGGAKGAVYDASDLSTLYLDSAGTTPAVVNGLVGLQLDKSQGLAIGSELVTNGGFATDTNWVKGAGWTIAGGVGVATAASSPFYQTGVSIVSGRLYQITFTVTVTSGSIYSVVGSGQGLSRTTSGTYTQTITATSTSGQVELWGVGFTGTVDDVSVKEVAGNHRYQSTTGSKPILRGSPVGANLVTNGDFASDVSGWSAASGASISWASGKMRVTNGGAGRGTGEQAFTTVIGKVYRVRFSATAGTAASAFFGVAQGSGPASFIAGVSNSLGTDFYFTAVGTTTYVYAQPNITTAGVYIDVDNIEVHDVSAGQVQAPYWLQYDGVDDFLLTAAVDFTATDKMFVCAGVRKLVDATQVIAELSNAWTANTGSFALYQDTSGTQLYASASRGTAAAAANQTASVTTTYTAPRTSVISSTHDIAGDSTILRVDGAQVGSATGDKGAGNFGNQPIYFGRRGGASLPLNGLESRTVICGKTLSASELASTERWVNQQTLAY